MSQYFAIFQISPVQEFIQCARRTLDFWSGSFLLSYLSAVTIQTLGKKNVVFPSVDDNPMYDHLSTLGAGVPWSTCAPKAIDAYRPTIPQRLFAIFDNDPATLLDNAADAVQEAWKHIAQKAFGRLPNSVKNNPEWKTIWERQVKAPFSTLYVWRESPHGENYGDGYRRTETLLGMRKATRFFVWEDPEPGHKCSLCGIREALRLTKPGNGGRPTRRDIRDQWANHVRKHSLTYDFKEGETLCAVCTIKRLAPEAFFGFKAGVPSTSTVAVGATVRQIRDLRQSSPPDFSNKVKAFLTKAQQAAPKCGLPETSAPLPCNEGALKSVDGDWYLTDFYEKQKKEFPAARGEFVAAEKALSELLGELAGPADSPGKYLAVITADGDKMGETLSRVTDRNTHEKISRAVGEFAVKHAVSCIQEKRLGYAIYFGGDEGVALTSLQDLFVIMGDLRKNWDEKVCPVFEGAGLAAPGLSVGAAIAHHQEGLRSMIALARESLDTAKSLSGKDAFCVTLRRRSSGEMVSRAHWTLDGVSIIEVLKIFHEAYLRDELSPRWINDLRLEEEALGDPPAGMGPADTGTWTSRALNMTDAEIGRLIQRHSADPNAAVTAQLVDHARQINSSLYDQHPPGEAFSKARFRDFIALMDLAHYVAKGGGR